MRTCLLFSKACCHSLCFSLRNAVQRSFQNWTRYGDELYYVVKTDKIFNLAVKRVTVCRRSVHLWWKERQFLTGMSLSDNTYNCTLFNAAFPAIILCTHEPHTNSTRVHTVKLHWLWCTYGTLLGLRKTCAYIQAFCANTQSKFWSHLRILIKRFIKQLMEIIELKLWLWSNITLH